MECRSEEEINIEMVSGRLLYRACVKVLNKKKMNGRVDTPWRSVLGFNDDIKMEWSDIIQTTINQKVADLQWKILHESSMNHESL